MGQASSAQREPSMEEILASIRRIIEDSDTARQPAGDDAFSAAAENDIGADVANDSGRRPDSTAFSARIDAPTPILPEAVEIEGPQPYEEDAAPAAGYHPLDDEPAGAAGPAESLSSDDETAAPLRAGDAFLDIEPGDGEPAEARPAIISDSTGRQVAAAFGELSEAFATTRRRSLDEVAEEMLRPMLQQWLDDNLPTLVERLVREEIERVARGGQG